MCKVLWSVVLNKRSKKQISKLLLVATYRRSTVLGLLHQKQQWQDKEKMLLNQLWAALEEKLEHKSMLNEAKIALEKIKGE